MHYIVSVFFWEIPPKFYQRHGDIEVFDGTPQSGSNGMIPQKTMRLRVTPFAGRKRNRKMTQRRTPINFVLTSKQRFSRLESGVFHNWNLDSNRKLEFFPLGSHRLLVIQRISISIQGISCYVTWNHRIAWNLQCLFSWTDWWLHFRKSASVCLCHMWETNKWV